MKVRISGQSDEWEVRFERGKIPFLGLGRGEESPSWILESPQGVMYRINAQDIDAKDLERQVSRILGEPASAEVIRQFDPAPITDPATGGSYLWPRREQSETPNAGKKPRHRRGKKPPGV